MILILSPAKKLDFSEETRFTKEYSLPTQLDESQVLVNSLAKMSVKKIGTLMSLSDNLSQLNHERYQQFHTPFHPENAKQALLSFKGDAYLSFDLDQYSEEEFAFAQKHLRILSGLYGLLKPLDLIQPYRLEMGTKLKVRRKKNLYEFWGDKITTALNEAIEASGSPVLVNLASNEYFKSVKPKSLNARTITINFKDNREGKLKSIFLFIKQARGAMCDYAIKEKITDPEDLKASSVMGYQFHEELSTEDNWIFTR